jgi:hypothetical protein
VVLLVCRPFSFKESLLEGLDPYSIKCIYHVLLEELGCSVVPQQWGAPTPAGGWDAEQWEGKVLQGAFAPVSRKGLGRCLTKVKGAGYRILAPDLRETENMEPDSLAVVVVCPQVVYAAVTNPAAKMVDLNPQLRGPWGQPCTVSFGGFNSRFRVGGGNTSLQQGREAACGRMTVSYDVC